MSKGDYHRQVDTLRTVHGASVRVVNEVDEERQPAGGSVVGPGLTAVFQDGPIGGGMQTGAMVEDMLLAAASRLAFYQSGRFACQENAEAAEHVWAALRCLDARTNKRTARGVEGTHQE